MMQSDTLLVAIVTVSDRVSCGEAEDRGGPTIEAWLKDRLLSPWQSVKRVIANDRLLIEETLITLCDQEKCHLIVTTGGTGPAKRDVTPEATEAVSHKRLPGFGELMRTESLRADPTAVLSRQTAGIREKSLIINLPGKPAAINDCLNTIFPSVPYCIDLIEGPYIETNPNICQAFRPKHAIIKRQELLKSLGNN